MNQDTNHALKLASMLDELAAKATPHAASTLAMTLAAIELRRLHGLIYPNWAVNGQPPTTTVQQ